MLVKKCQATSTYFLLFSTDLLLAPKCSMVMKDLQPTGPVDMNEYTEYGEQNAAIDRHFSSAWPQMDQAYCGAQAFGGE